MSAAISAVLTGVVYVYARRRGVLDEPNARSSHSVPTPRGGGLALLIASELGIAIAAASRLASAMDALILGTGLVVIGAIGWLDDLRGVHPAARLAVHASVALWTVAMSGGLPFVRMGETALRLGAAGWIVGVLGIVWSINLFNFMDGIDGLAGAQAVLVFGAAALLLFLRGDPSLGSIAAVVGGAALGFLVWNLPPARIFMGDVGSGALGYLVAAIAVRSENRGAIPLAAFAILNGLFVADATVTLTRRILRRRQLTQAHRDHTYQRLSRAWGSHLAVTWRASAVTIGLTLLAAVATLVSWLLVPALLVAYLLLAALLLAAEREAPL